MARENPPPLPTPFMENAIKNFHSLGTLPYGHPRSGSKLSPVVELYHPAILDGGQFLI